MPFVSLHVFGRRRSSETHSGMPWNPPGSGRHFRAEMLVSTPMRPVSSEFFYSCQYITVGFLRCQENGRQGRGITYFHFIKTGLPR